MDTLQNYRKYVIVTAASLCCIGSPGPLLHLWTKRHGVKHGACGFFLLFPSVYMSFRIDHSQCDDVCAGGIRAGLSRGFQERSSNSADAEMAAEQNRARPAVTTGTSKAQNMKRLKYCLRQIVPVCTPLLQSCPSPQ